MLSLLYKDLWEVSQGGEVHLKYAHHIYLINKWDTIKIDKCEDGRDVVGCCILGWLGKVLLDKMITWRDLSKQNFPENKKNKEEHSR